MDLISPNLNLPYIAPAQAQKHVTHNEAIRRLDALVHLSVSDIFNTPPTEPSAGERVIIGTEPTGAFSNLSGQIAAYQDGAWVFYEPQTGWQSYVQSLGNLQVFDGSAWVGIGGEDTETSGSNSGDIDTLDMLGINATADEINRLAVRSPASLFDHEGTGHQLKINKASLPDTASLLFQTEYSGRAELGLTGSDNVEFKVSADGSTWHTAWQVNATDGSVTFPETDFDTGGSGASTSANASGSVGAIQYADPANGFSGDSANLVWDDTHSRLGIGDATPSYTVDIGVPSATLNLGRVGTGAPSIFMRGTQVISYYAGRMRFNSGVVVGPAAILDNSYLINLVTGATTNGIIARAPSSGVSETFKIRAHGSDTTHFTVNSDGSAYFMNAVQTDSFAKVGTYTVVTVPLAATAGAGAIIYVSDETGGGVLAFSDGTDWRRITDRAVIS